MLTTIPRDNCERSAAILGRRGPVWRLAMTGLFLLCATPCFGEGHRGGTLRLLAGSGAGTIDPQINYTLQYWQLFILAYDGLVAFRKTGGPAGLEIVPDLATAVPTPEEGGLLWHFQLRPGIRFSTGALVTGADVAASFRRLFRIGSPTAESFYGAIEGADSCLHTPACTLPGVHTDGDAITIRLTRPDPEFLTKLALPHAGILPADAPLSDTGANPLPGTGPYVIQSYDANDGVHLVRNPHFHEWNDEAQPDGYADAIDYEFGLESEAEITAIQNNQADWTFDTPSDRLGELGAHYASQLHLTPSLAMWYLPMNVNLPPFDDVRVRRALNLAVDRAAAVKLFGGSRLAVPGCQFLPPGMMGRVEYCPYAPNLPEARRLVAESGTAGQTVTLVTDDSPAGVAIGTYLLDVLRDIGFVPRLRTLSGAIQFTYIQNTANRVQLSLGTWYADYPSPLNYIGGAFGCAAFRPGSDASPNVAGFCNPALDAALADAVGRDDAAGVAAVDRALTDAAPAVVLFHPRDPDFVSARLGNFQFHKQFRWLIGQAWVQ